MQLTVQDIIYQIKERENSIQSDFWKIGDLLIALKETIEHGEWEKTIRENFSFSERHARTFIAIRKSFKTEIISDLGLTKCIELLKLSEEYREEFVETFKPEFHTTREIKEGVSQFKAIKQIETPKNKKKEEFDAALYTLYRFAKEVQADYHNLLHRVGSLNLRVENLKNEEKFNSYPKKQDILNILNEVGGLNAKARSS